MELTSLTFSSVQSLSRVWLCDRMNRSMPGLPVHHQLTESTQTHVHWVGDAIQPSISSSVVPSFSCPQYFLASGQDSSDGMVETIQVYKGWRENGDCVDILKFVCDLKEVVVRKALFIFLFRLGETWT